MKSIWIVVLVGLVVGYADDGRKDVADVIIDSAIAEATEQVDGVVSSMLSEGVGHVVEHFDTPCCSDTANKGAKAIKHTRKHMDKGMEATKEVAEDVGQVLADAAKQAVKSIEKASKRAQDQAEKSAKDSAAQAKKAAKQAKRATEKAAKEAGKLSKKVAKEAKKALDKSKEDLSNVTKAAAKKARKSSKKDGKALSGMLDEFKDMAFEIENRGNEDSMAQNYQNEEALVSNNEQHEQELKEFYEDTLEEEEEVDEDPEPSKDTWENVKIAHEFDVSPVQAMEDCMACKYVWKTVEKYIGNTRQSHVIEQYFRQTCGEASRTQIFYLPVGFPFAHPF